MDKNQIQYFKLVKRCKQVNKDIQTLNNCYADLVFILDNMNEIDIKLKNLYETKEVLEETLKASRNQYTDVELKTMSEEYQTWQLFH